MITEAGGLIGNFTGESDYLYQREVVAGNPKVYGQLVQILAPYTRVIKDEPKEGADAPAAAAAADATQAFVSASGVSEAAAGVGIEQPAAPARKAPLRIRKADPSPGDDAPV